MEFRMHHHFILNVIDVCRGGAVHESELTVMCHPSPEFHEEWYKDSELALLEAAVRFTKPPLCSSGRIRCLGGSPYMCS